MAVFGVKWSKSDFLKANLSSKSVFYKNQFHFEIWCVVKLFYLKIWHVLKTSIRNLSSGEKTAISLTHLKFLIQSMPLCTTKDSKIDYFKSFRFKKTFIKEKKNNFFRNNFSKNAQKSQLWRFYGVIWPDKWFFESEFSNKFWFSKNSFFIKIWCVVKPLIEVLTLCGYSIQTLTRSIFYSNIWGIVEKIGSQSDFSRSFRFKAFFFRNIALRNKLSKKVGKRQLWHFNGVNWQKKDILKANCPRKLDVSKPVSRENLLRC